MAGNEGTLSMKLVVRDDGSIVLDKFSGKLAEVPKHIDNMSRSLSLIKWDSLTNLGKAFLQVSERVYGFARGIASSANEIEKMAQISGLSIGMMQKLSFAAKMSDIDSSELAKGMRLLSKNMEQSSQGTGEATKWFQLMGVSVKDSSGNLIPLDMMLGQIADKFSTWKDGPAKIAASLALFGRSGESLIPILNRGSTGMRELYSEAEKLGVVLDDKVVQAGAHAETAFKHFESQISSLKISLSPLVEELSKALGGMTDLINKSKELAFPNIPKLKAPAYELTEQQKLFDLWGWGVSRRKAIPHKPELWEIFGGESFAGQAGKVQPPGLPDEKLLEKLQKLQFPKMPEDMWAYFKEAPGYIQLIIDGELKQVIAVSEIDAQLKKELEDREKLQNSFFDQYDIMKKIGALGYEVPTQIEDQIMEMRSFNAELSERLRTDEAISKQLSERFETVKAIGGLGYEVPTEEQTMRMNLRSFEKIHDQAQKVGDFWDNITHQMGTAFSDNFINLANSGFKNLGDSVRAFGMDALSIFEKLILNAAIFGNIMGEKKLGGGYGGLVGLFGGLITSILGEGGVMNASFSPIRSFQGGGYADRPTLGVFGEGGPEAFVPLRNGKIPIEGGRGKTVININNTNLSMIDTQSGRDFIRRNQGNFLEMITKDKDSAGPMRRL